MQVDCSEDYAGLSVNVNGKRIFGADNDSRKQTHVIGSGLVTLQAGDVVFTNHYNSVGSVDAGNESTFSGFLVK